MIQLTGKCKEDFEKWLWENHQDTVLGCPCYDACSCVTDNFWDLPDIVQYAFIIEFFDNLGEYVNVIKFEQGWAGVCNHTLDFFHKTRKEALIAAIKEAKNRYNNG